MPEMVTLRTGARVPQPIVTATMITLQTMWTEEPMPVVDLVRKARDPDSRLPTYSAQVLDSLGLLDSAGQVEPTVREIVLSAVEGEGLDLALRSPIG